VKQSKLYSLLSNDNRLQILSILSSNPSRFTDIQKTLKISSPELARQIKRLTEGSLIEKSGETYTLTQLGRLVKDATQLTAYLCEAADYLSTHNVSPIPIHLLRTLDSLSETRILPSAYSLLDTLNAKVSTVKTRYWDMSDDYPSLLLGTVEELLDEDVEIRILYPRVTIERARHEVNTGILDRIHVKALPAVNVTVVVSDSFAMLGLPDRHGAIDRQHYLFGESPRFIDWCEAFFLYSWERAEII
jgi:predicted transcriptional regulator